MVWSFVAVVYKQLVFATQNFPLFLQEKSAQILLHLSLPLVLSLVVRDCLTVGSIIPYGFSLPLEPITLAKEFGSGVLMWPKPEQPQWSSCLFLGQWNKDALYVLREMRKQSPRDCWQLSGDHERRRNSTECMRERKRNQALQNVTEPLESSLFSYRNQLTSLLYQLWVEFSVTSSWEKTVINISSFGLWPYPNTYGFMKKVGIVVSFQVKKYRHM